MTVGWFEALLGGPLPAEGEVVERHGVRLIGRNKITRAIELVDEAQAQARETFAYKWQQRDTYASNSVKDAQIAWLDSRYGGRDLLAHLGPTSVDRPLVLDVGCGSGFSAKLLFRQSFDKIHYVGSDISEAVDIAAEEIGAITSKAFFLQADLMRLPFGDGLFDIVFSEGVLHDTPSTRGALLSVSRFVKPGGILAAYVYNKKAPIREFTDDYVREQIADLKPEVAWAALEPLTRLGIALGELKTEIDVPEDVPLLGIAKGRYDIQRLFYWAICKTYYRPEFSFDEMNHINFDWFTPKYCHRQTPDDVAAWCQEAALTIEYIKAEEAGITFVARRSAAVAG